MKKKKLKPKSKCDSLLLIAVCNTTVLECLMFDVSGWIEQNSNPSQSQNAREPKIPLS